MKKTTKPKKEKISDDLSPNLPGTLFVVATPIGNTQDWTERAKDILANADIVAAEDTRILKRELGKIKITPKKVLSHHEHNEALSTKGLLDALKSGQDVALASDAGTPQIQDPGYHIIKAALAEGIKIVPVPGPSSLTSALSVCPFGGRTVFFGGFLPTQSETRKRDLARFKRRADTLVFFEAPHRLRETLVDAEEILGPTTPTLVCRELTKTYEEVRHSTLEDARKYFNLNEPRGEFVVLFKGTPAETLNEQDIHSEVTKLLGFGRSASDILEELQPLTELTRKQLYDIINRVKNSF